MVSPLLLLLLLSSATYCHFFFLKSGTLIFGFFGITITDGCLHSGFALPSLWVRSAFAPMSGGKEYSKRYEIDFTITIYRIENWLARRVAKREFVVQYDDNECD